MGKIMGKLPIPGGAKSRFASIFYAIKHRCNNPGATGWDIYGGKGVKCKWNNVIEFYNDMFDGYVAHCNKYGEKNTSIDRIDSGGDYCKENCRWATRIIQSNNKSDNLHIEIDGINYTARSLSEKLGISRELATQRIRLYKKGKLSYNALISEGVYDRSKIAITLDGEDFTEKEFAKKFGIGCTTAARRIKKYKEGEYTYEQLTFKGRGNPRSFNKRERGTKKTGQ